MPLPCEVLQIIDSAACSDVLVKGLPTSDDVAELSQGRGGKVYKSLWPGRWVIRIWKHSFKEAT